MNTAVLADSAGSFEPVDNFELFDSLELVGNSGRADNPVFVGSLEPFDSLDFVDKLGHPVNFRRSAFGMIVGRN